MLCEVVRERKVFARADRPAGERPGELDREERGAAGEFDDSSEQPAIGHDAEAIEEHAARGAHAQSSHVELLDRLERALERDGSVRASGHEEADRLVAEPAGGEDERLRRGRIQPMRVVDRDDHAATGRELAQNVEQRQPDRPAIKRLLRRLLAQQRDTECAPPRRCDAGEIVERDILEQVAESCERELGFGVARARCEDAELQLAGRADARLPERRLADARRAREDECACRSVRLDEAAHALELGLATDDRPTPRDAPSYRSSHDPHREGCRAARQPSGAAVRSRSRAKERCDGHDRDLQRRRAADRQGGPRVRDQLVVGAVVLSRWPWRE